MQVGQCGEQQPTAAAVTLSAATPMQGMASNLDALLYSKPSLDEFLQFPDPRGAFRWW
jgi:hypothetical protein